MCVHCLQILFVPRKICLATIGVCTFRAVTSVAAFFIFGGCKVWGDKKRIIGKKQLNFLRGDEK